MENQIQLNAPENLTITNNDFINYLTWSNVENVESYHVYRKQQDNFSLYAIVTTNNYQDSNIQPNTRYEYYVTSYLDIESEPSNIVSITTNRLEPVNNITYQEGENSIYLSWSKVEHAQEYQIQRSLSSQGDFEVIALTTNTSYLDNNLLEDTTYYYIINAVGGLPSTTIEVKTKSSLIDKPTIISIQAISPSEVVLNWAKTNQAKTYQVYRGSNPNNLSQISEVDDLNYHDRNLKPNTMYYYALRSRNDNQVSDFTTPIEVTTNQVETVTNLTATPVSPTQINLSWTKLDLSNGYIIYRSDNTDNNYLPINTVDNNFYQDTSLTPSTTYYYRVSNIYQTEESALSNVVQAITPSNETSLTPPTNILLTTINCQKIRITFTPVNNINEYNVYISNDNNQFTLVNSTTSNQFIINNLQANTTYYISLSSVNGTQESALSSSVMITTPICENRYFIQSSKIIRCNNQLYKCSLVRKLPCSCIE